MGNKILAKGFGDFFQVDHCVEQRILNHAAFAVGDGSKFMVHTDDFHSLIVPTDALRLGLLNDQAKTLPGFTQELAFKYTHGTKTQMLKKLIPHSKEAEFTTQQILDAHVLTYRQLGFSDKFIEAYVYGDVASLVKAAREETKFDKALMKATRLEP